MIPLALKKGPCTVARVSAYEVVFEYGGRTVELGYPNPTFLAKASEAVEKSDD